MSSYEIYEKIRISKGMKNSDVSRLAKIPPSTFTDWKNGKSSPKTEKMEKIADALGVSVAFLMFGETDKIIDVHPTTEELRENMEHRVDKYDMTLEVIEKFENLPDDKKELVLRMLDRWGVK